MDVPKQFCNNFLSTVEKSQSYHPPTGCFAGIERVNTFIAAVLNLMLRRVWEDAVKQEILLASMLLMFVQLNKFNSLLTVLE